MTKSEMGNIGELLHRFGRDCQIFHMIFRKFQKLPIFEIGRTKPPQSFSAISAGTANFCHLQFLSNLLSLQSPPFSVIRPVLARAPPAAEHPLNAYFRAMLYKHKLRKAQSAPATTARPIYDLNESQRIRGASMAASGSPLRGFWFGSG